MFKLSRYFSITSFIAFVLVALLLGYTYRQIMLSNLTQIAESKNVALTQTFANSLWPQFSLFIDETATLPPQELQNHPNIPTLRQAVLAQMENLSVVKVKVYDLNGLTVFSTQASQIGETKLDNAGYLSARDGVTANELTYRDSFSAFEQTIEDRNVFSSYIPIQPGGSNSPIEGVFEIYDDVTPLIEQINTTQRNITILVAAILSVLYLILFFIVKRADNIIRRQYTDLAESREALRESRELFRRVVTSISDHIYVSEIDDNQELSNRYISPNVEDLTGYPASRLLEDWSFWPSTLIHSEDKAIAQKQAKQLAKGQASQSEYRLIRADGDIIWVRDSGQVEADEQARKLVVYGVVSDITERKQFETALTAARDEALQASKLKTQLLANVSHDLRTPLNAILGFSEMLQGGVYGPLSNPQQEAIAEIIDSTAQLLDFVNNLLNQAQIDAGKLILHNVEFTPTDLLDNGLSYAKMVAQTKGLQLTSAIASDMPQTLWGDPYWLRQILINLVNNSLKFTNEGTVHVQLALANKNEWLMQVSDTGIGIPAEAQTSIFEAFSQVDNTSARRQVGTGLGLSIVKELTSLMAGNIALESEEGQGTTITLTFPIKSPQ